MAAAFLYPAYVLPFVVFMTPIALAGLIALGDTVHPDTFMIDRQHNRHVAFGKGIHRCLGSNLARMELKVAIEEWLDRIPTFEIVDPAAVTWTGGQVRGPRTIPVRW